MKQICSIVGCNKPIVIKQDGDEHLQCCEEHIDEVKSYYEEKYNQEQQELYDFWLSTQ